MSTKLIVGNKYVPHQKTAYGIGLESSGVWKYAQKIKQPYLYYLGTNSEGYHRFSTSMDSSADYFNPEDVTPYDDTATTVKLRKGNVVSAIKLPVTSVCGTSFTYDVGRKIKSVKGETFQLEGDTNLWFYLKDFRRADARGFETTETSTPQYEVGDTVRLVSERPGLWNSEGLMDHFLGKEVVITSISTARRTFEFDGSEDWIFRLSNIEKLVNNKTNTNIVMTKYTVTRKQLSEIHPQVCSKWQSIIEETIKSDIFADSFEVAHPAVSKAFEEADSSQTKMLSKYFPTFKRSSAIREAVEKIGKTIYIGYKVVIDEEKSRIFIPLPNANSEWSLAAFDYVIAFIKAYPKSYPVHNVGKDKAPSGLLGGNSCLVIQFDI